MVTAVTTRRCASRQGQLRAGHPQATYRAPNIPRSQMRASLSSMQNRLNILHGGTIASMVDLGGSLAVASMGLYSTGVSTDLNGRGP